MKKIILVALLAMTQSLFSAESPVGKWKSIDDETKEAKSIIKIYQEPDGTVAGKVIKLLQKPGALCEKCKGADKNKPIEGMKILWGLKDAGDSWDSGTILDPKKGKTYRAEIKVINKGRALKVTGKFLFISRSQVWQRID